MGTGPFSGVASGRDVTLTPHPFLVSRSEDKAKLYYYFLYRSSCLWKGWTYLQMSCGWFMLYGCVTELGCDYFRADSNEIGWRDFVCLLSVVWLSSNGSSAWMTVSEWRSQPVKWVPYEHTLTRHRNSHTGTASLNWWKYESLERAVRSNKHEAVLRVAKWTWDWESLAMKYSDTRYYAKHSNVVNYNTLAVNTGRFIMLSVIIDIYNKETKGPILMELFAVTGKLKIVFLTRDVRSVHYGCHGTHRYDIQVLVTHASTWLHRHSSLLQWSVPIG
jgi:hypothetical protein